MKQFVLILFLAALSISFPRAAFAYLLCSDLEKFVRLCKDEGQEQEQECRDVGSASCVEKDGSMSSNGNGPNQKGAARPVGPAPDIEDPSGPPSKTPKTPTLDEPVPSQSEGLGTAKTTVEEGAQKNKAKIAETETFIKKTSGISEGTVEKTEKTLRESDAKVAAEKDAKKRAALKLQLDREKAAVAKAKKAVKDKKPFPESEIADVKDPKLKKQLELVSAAQSVREGLHSEKDRLTVQLAELISLGNKIAEKQAGLDDSARISDTKSLIAQKDSTKSSSSPVLQKLDSQVAEKRDADKLASGNLDSKSVDIAFAEKIKDTGNGKLTAAEKLKIIQSLALKGPLSEKLKAERKALEAQLAVDAASKNTAADILKNPAASMTLDALDSSPSEEELARGHSRRLSLANSDSEAEVKRMIQELEASGDSKAANDLKAGILENDSPSLFERVHATVTLSLRQQKIISRY